MNDDMDFVFGNYATEAQAARAASYILTRTPGSADREYLIYIVALASGGFGLIGPVQGFATSTGEGTLQSTLFLRALGYNVVALAHNHARGNPKRGKTGSAFLSDLDVALVDLAAARGVRLAVYGVFSDFNIAVDRIGPGRDKNGGRYVGNVLFSSRAAGRSLFDGTTLGPPPLPSPYPVNDYDIGANPSGHILNPTRTGRNRGTSPTAEGDRLIEPGAGTNPAPESPAPSSSQGSSDRGRPGTNGPKDNSFPSGGSGTSGGGGSGGGSGGGGSPPETSSGGGDVRWYPADGSVSISVPDANGMVTVTNNKTGATETVRAGEARLDLDGAHSAEYSPPPGETKEDTASKEDDADAGKSGSGNGEVGGYVDPNDTTGTGGGGGGDESRRFHSNYLPMETRALLGFAELARAHAPERPAPPGGGPTDRGGWKPVRARGAAATHPPEGPPGGNRLQNALVDDAASRLMGGARIPRMGTDGPGQVPLNAAALAKAARPILRTVGDDEEAAAKASRDEVRQLLWNTHVAPIIRLTNQLRAAGVQRRAR